MRSRAPKPNEFTPSGIFADNSNNLDGIDSSSFVRDTGDETIAGVKTFSAGVKSTEKLVVPLNQPTVLENGDIWIAP